MNDSVAKRSPASEAMLQAATKGRALMGGTSAMQDAGVTYLPRFPAESDEGYKARLKLSWLFNGYRKTVRDMAGRVFDKPIELGEGASPELMEWAQNVDMEGQDLSTFALRVFADAVSGCGISYIMVDAPSREGVVTRASADAANLRPYFVHLSVEDILGWKTHTVGNLTKLSQVRIMEKLCVDDPGDEFNLLHIEQVRVLDALPNGVQVRLYQKNDKADWLLVDEPRMTGVPEITIVPFYANRTGYFTGEPLLDDLADVNIAHWQSQSDQRNILHAARVPILHSAGRDEDEGEIVISASQAIKSRDSGAKLEWVEHGGQSVGAGRQDLKDLEFQMEAHGLQLLVAKSGAQSATGEALDAKKETSTLSMTADALKDALEQAFIFAGEYSGSTDVVEVSVNKEFGVTMLNAQEVTALLSAVNTGNLSRKTFLHELARRGYIRPDLDPDEETDQIETEGEGMMDGGLDGVE